MEALPDAEVLDYFAFGYRDLVRGGMSDVEGERETVARVAVAAESRAAATRGMKILVRHDFSPRRRN
jgi:hypothetical protein